MITTSGRLKADLAYRLVSGSRLSDDLDAVERGEKGREPAPYDRVVVGQQDPNGRRVWRLGRRHVSIMKRIRRSVWGPGPTGAGTFPGSDADDSGHGLRRWSGRWMERKRGQHPYARLEDHDDRNCQLPEHTLNPPTQGPRRQTIPAHCRGRRSCWSRPRRSPSVDCS